MPPSSCCRGDYALEGRADFIEAIAGSTDAICAAPGRRRQRPGFRREPSRDRAAGNLAGMFASSRLQ